MTHSQNESVDFNYKWGDIKLEKLSRVIDLQRVRQATPIITDEPLLPNILCSESNFLDHFHYLNKNQSQESQKEDKKTTTANKLYKFKPSIDSYIINTIKLNQLLQNQIQFDQVNFFLKSKKKKSKKFLNQKKKSPKINSDQDARCCLRQFITIISMHCGFTEASSFALDTLVDVLDHFLESFFKLFKNLQSIHQFDLNKNEEKPFNSYFSSGHFIEQALEESGFGTIQEIKDFYINDIILYFRETYKKVSKLYEEYRAKKQAEKLEENKSMRLDVDMPNLKTEHDIHLEEFMRDNDFLNDESNSILGELLTDLNVTHLDEEMNKLLQIIGHDPFSLMTDDLQGNLNSEIHE